MSRTVGTEQPSTEPPTDETTMKFTTSPSPAISANASSTSLVNMTEKPTIITSTINTSDDKGLQQGDFIAVGVGAFSGKINCWA